MENQSDSNASLTTESFRATHFFSLYFRLQISKQTKEKAHEYELSLSPHCSFSTFHLQLKLQGFCSCKSSASVQMETKNSNHGEVRVGEVWLLTCPWDVLFTLLTSALLSLAQISTCGPKNRQANENEYSYTEAVDGDEENNNDGGFVDTEEELSSGDEGGAGNNYNGKSNDSSKAGAGGDGGEEDEEEEDVNNHDDNDDSEVDGEDQDDDDHEENEDEDKVEDKDEEETVDEEEPDDEEDEEEEALQPPKKRKK